MFRYVKCHHLRCGRIWLAVPAIGLLAAQASSGSVAAGAAPIERLSVTSAGVEADSASWGPMAISFDGRFVAFTSSASNLVAGDTNGSIDIFVRDRVRARTERVSLTATGQQVAEGANAPSISGNGRLVSFETGSSDVVADDTNGQNDIFVRDRWTHTTVRASVSSTGAEGNGLSDGSSLSANGRYVAFTSYSSNLVADDTNGQPDAFVRDLVKGSTVRVSVSSTGAQANDGSFNYAALSAGGRYVVFASHASNLVPGDTNATEDVFRRDLWAGRTIRVSVAKHGGQSDGDSWYPQISADGSKVAFQSTASNLVSGDANGSITDVFVRDLTRGRNILASVSATGVAGNDSSGLGEFSADGKRVVFASLATNLAGPDTNGSPDVFLRDLGRRTTAAVAVGLGATAPNGASDFPVISGNGRWVAFLSEAMNLVPGDTNGAGDIFVAAPC